MAGSEPGAAVGVAPAVSGNRLADFPAAEFTIHVFCEHCNHQAEIERRL